MTSSTSAGREVIAAANEVRRAAEAWDAVDLIAIGDCFSMLEQSAARLNQTLKNLIESPLRATDLPVVQLLEIKKTSLRLERLVDSSAAFLRSAPGADSGETGIYQAGGAFCASASTMEGLELQA